MLETDATFPVHISAASDGDLHTFHKHLGQAKGGCVRKTTAIGIV
jgi:hypothetical protein